MTNFSSWCWIVAMMLLLYRSRTAALLTPCRGVFQIHRSRGGTVPASTTEILAPQKNHVRAFYQNTRVDNRRGPSPHRYVGRFLSSRPLDAGSSSNHAGAPPHEAGALTEEQKESMLSSSTMILALPTEYLWASDPQNFDPQTFQRTDVYFDPRDGKVNGASDAVVPEIESVQLQSDKYEVQWSNGHRSTYSVEWVVHELNQWQGVADQPVFVDGPDDLSLQHSENQQKRLLWSGLTETDLRSSSQLCLDFGDIVHDNGNDEAGMKRALAALYQYGILLVTNTPTSDGGAGVAALGAALGGGQSKSSDNPTSLVPHYRRGESIIGLEQGTDGPLRTLYGTVWFTTSAVQAAGTSVADSAYGVESLPLHTDMTYHRDPPGLQIFTMVQPAARGGESIVADGFRAAHELQQSHPDAFEILSQTSRRYRCVDPETGWNLQATGPVISVDPHHPSVVTGIRHNDLDRLPDLPPPPATQTTSATTTNNANDYYYTLRKAHQAWDAILSQDRLRLVIRLQPGETLVVANQRCLHARCSFDANEYPRSVMGCYVSQDELNSRFRWEGMDVL